MGHVRDDKGADNFWELLDELLSAVLFVLIGLEVLILSFQRAYLLAGLVAIPLVLAARWFSVFLQVKAFSFVREFSERAITILTWGGLRGGISVALALSPPLGATRDALVMITYIVVVFSILVQGLTINRLHPHARRSQRLIQVTWVDAAICCPSGPVRSLPSSGHARLISDAHDSAVVLIDKTPLRM